eukprot:Nitzschia sp. Nitz4//scaffold4_size323378//32810//33175//NITZ4_000617-RA/size323378-processed-gene-0.328-mRNA-1//-1//CDS//3329553270//9174//frame0
MSFPIGQKSGTSTNAPNGRTSPKDNNKARGEIRRGPTPELQDERPTKRVRTESMSEASQLSSEQKCFLEAALALKVSETKSPETTPKSQKVLMQGGLPPPPFPLSQKQESRDGLNSKRSQP